MQDKKLPKMALKKITKDGPMKGENKTYYGKDGQKISAFEYHFGNSKGDEKQTGEFLEDTKKRLKETDVKDKAVEKKRKRDLKMKRKIAQKKEMGYDSDEV